MSDIKLADDGERMIPKLHGDSIMYAEHMTRYLAAAELVAGKTVLDIACGTGYGTQMLAGKAQKVYGIDISPEAIDYATAKFTAGNLSYAVGRAEQIELPDASVDVVVSFETLEHITDYKQFLSEIKRVLKPDGLAIISTPNDLEFAKGNHHHVHQFSETELQNILSKEFKNIKPYYQATWAYAQLSESRAILEPGSKDVTVHNFSPLKPEQYLYFYMLCSNRPITEQLVPIGGLGGHYSAREIGESREAHEKGLRDEFARLLAYEKNEHRKTKIKLKAKEGQIHAITTSSSYKLARLLAHSKAVARLNMSRAKSLHPKRVQMMRRNRLHVTAVYKSPQFLSAFESAPTADLAVVIHLYYVEMLPFFIEKLHNISSLKYDLYITVPVGKEVALDAIREQFPEARVAIVPNCGRDVLPFVQVVKQIEDKGYIKVLKLHSKKSPHRDDGEQWRDKIIDSLVPADPKVVKQLTAQLDDPQTALLGPEGEFVSLLVNFTSTAHHVKPLTDKIMGGKSGNDLVTDADEYGFFAGTMFWARLDALAPVIDAVSVTDFEPELGQEDSTLAHALERMLSVIPELQGKNMYEMQRGGVVKIDPHTTNIPKWSEVALDDD